MWSWMRGFAGANAVGGPKVGAVVVEGDVAFAFESGADGRFPNEEAVGDEPVAKVGRLGAALLVREAGDSGGAVVDEAGVAEKDHVRATGFGVKEADVSDAAEDVVNSLPLGEGEIA